MQKTPSLRPGQQRPVLSELLRRRGQTLVDYTKELQIHGNDQLQMHCMMHGVDCDVAFPPKPQAPKPVPAKKPEPKSEQPKNALKDLAKQEVKKMGPTEGQ